MRTLRVQFWAPYRGRVDVYVSIARVGLSADWYAEWIVRKAYEQYHAKWTFPHYDRKLMCCVGIEEGGRQVT